MKIEYTVFDFVNWTTETRVREIPDDPKELFKHNALMQRLMKEAEMAKKPRKPKPRPGC